MAEKTAILYRCYDSCGCLLYVGRTTRKVGVRLAEHATQAAWWGEVARVSCEQVPAHRAAFLEAIAIRAERPRCNVTPGPGPECWLCDDRGWVNGAGWTRDPCPRCLGGQGGTMLAVGVFGEPIRRWGP